MASPSKKSNLANKILLSAGLILASAAYAMWISLTAQPQSLISTTPPPISDNGSPSQNNPSTTQNPTPTPKAAGRYVDGTYTGSQADAFYGIVQVQAVISGGQLTDVQFLKFPNDQSTSQYVSSFSKPQLISEAIQAQSANVDVIAGATDTSEAFMQSLGAALTQAQS